MKNYFSNNELKCKCGCDVNKFNPDTLAKLNRLREDYGKPIIINSAYRCKNYNIKIGATQTHATGQAVDISVDRKNAYRIIPLIYRMGFTGLGIKQHGSGRFLHIDDLEEILPKQPRPAIWSYK